MQSPAGPGSVHATPKLPGLGVNPTLDCLNTQFCRVRGDVVEIEPWTFIFSDVLEEIPMCKDEVAHSMSFISA
jgi:hypothetical protein